MLLFLFPISFFRYLLFPSTSLTFLLSFLSSFYHCVRSPNSEAWRASIRKLCTTVFCLQAASGPSCSRHSISSYDTILPLCHVLQTMEGCRLPLIINYFNPSSKPRLQTSSELYDYWRNLLSWKTIPLITRTADLSYSNESQSSCDLCDYCKKILARHAIALQ